MMEHFHLSPSLQGIATAVEGGDSEAAALAIAQAAAIDGGAAVAQALAQALAEGGGTAEAVSEALAEAYGIVSHRITGTVSTFRPKQQQQHHLS